MEGEEKGGGDREAPRSAADAEGEEGGGDGGRQWPARRVESAWGDTKGSGPGGVRSAKGRGAGGGGRPEKHGRLCLTWHGPGKKCLLGHF